MKNVQPSNHITFLYLPALYSFKILRFNCVKIFCLKVRPLISNCSLTLKYSVKVVGFYSQNNITTLQYEEIHKVGCHCLFICNNKIECYFRIP